MFSSLRLVLFDDGNILHSVALKPWATWGILIGAAYSVLRAPVDLVLVILITRRQPKPPERKWSAKPPPG